MYQTKYFPYSPHNTILFSPCQGETAGNGVFSPDFPPVLNSFDMPFPISYPAFAAPPSRCSTPSERFPESPCRIPERKSTLPPAESYNSTKNPKLTLFSAKFPYSTTPSTCRRIHPAKTTNKKELTGKCTPTTQVSNAFSIYNILLYLQTHRNYSHSPSEICF